jgi:hypothetical protein
MGVHTHLITSRAAIPLMLRTATAHGTRGLVVEMTDGTSQANAEFRRNVGFYYDLVKANVERIGAGDGCPGRHGRSRVRSCHLPRPPAARPARARCAGPPTARPGHRRRPHPAAARSAGTSTPTAPPRSPQPGQGLLISVSSPFGDRGERACPGQQRAHRQPQDHRQPVPHPPPVPGSTTLASTASRPGEPSATAPARSARWPRTG